MDKIQKTLIKLGHKDLAQDYYEKISNLNKVAKLVTVEELSKVLMDNKLIDKPIRRKRVKSDYGENEIHLEGPKGIGTEIYGRKAMVYINFGTKEKREEAESILENENIKVNKRYSPGSGRTEIQVKYFKGPRWWE